MFSLKSLLFGVAVAGLGTAGLIHRTQLWASAFVAITLCLLLYAAFRAWLLPGAKVFWGPFAVTSALYLGIVSIQPLEKLHYNLPTTQLVIHGLDKLQRIAVGRSVYDPTQSIPPPATTFAVPPSPYYVAPSRGVGQIGAPLFPHEALFRMGTTPTSGEGFGAEASAFLWVAQCLWCLLLAALAGMTCTWFWGERLVAL